MINKKILIFLIFVTFFVIYLFNQGLFLNILLEPYNSKYGDINQNYTGYLINGDIDYTEMAHNIDDNTDYCVVFGAFFTNEGIYTRECNENYKYMKSETTKFDTNNIQEIDTLYYDSIYEYVYGIDSLERIDAVDNNSFPPYSLIYFNNNDNNDVSTFFPNNLLYSKMDYLYIDYTTDFINHMFRFQKRSIILVTVIIYVYILYEYIKEKQKRYSIYQLLGLSDFKILKTLIVEYVCISSLAFITSLGIYFLIFYLNGILFYIPMYFEYFSLESMTILYIKMLLFIIPISLLMMYGLYVDPLERRLK